MSLVTISLQLVSAASSTFPLCRRNVFPKCYRKPHGVSLYSTSDFKFHITKDLQTTKELEKEKWTLVAVSETGTLENDDVIVKFFLSIPYSVASVFFANDAKEILQVDLKETLRGKFYAMPHRIIKEMDGQNPTVIKKNEGLQIHGTFPRSWLPANCTKISAAVTGSDGTIYNYYGLENFHISILDLLVLEEYKSYQSEPDPTNTENFASL